MPPDDFSAGTVRIHLTTGADVEGQLVRTAVDTLYVREERMSVSALRALPRSQVERVDRRAFSTKRSIGLGAGIAIGAFAVFGAAMNYAQSRMHKVY